MPTPLKIVAATARSSAVACRPGAGVDQRGGVRHRADHSDVVAEGALDGVQGDARGDADDELLSRDHARDVFEELGEDLGLDRQDDDISPSCRLGVVAPRADRVCTCELGEAFGARIGGPDMRGVGGAAFEDAAYQRARHVAGAQERELLSDAHRVSPFAGDSIQGHLEWV
jgi:hypothetical protein